MLIKDDVVTFRWAIAQSGTPQVESYFDLQITKPDGSVTYQEGVDGAGGWQTDATYVANDNTPITGFDGNIETDLTLDQEGVWTIILGTGGAASFTILDQVLALVTTSEALVTNSVVLP